MLSSSVVLRASQQMEKSMYMHLDSLFFRTSIRPCRHMLTLRGCFHIISRMMAVDYSVCLRAPKVSHSEPKLSFSRLISGKESNAYDDNEEDRLYRQQSTWLSFESFWTRADTQLRARVIHAVIEIKKKK